MPARLPSNAGQGTRQNDSYGYCSPRQGSGKKLGPEDRAIHFFKLGHEPSPTSLQRQRGKLTVESPLTLPSLALRVVFQHENQAQLQNWRCGLVGLVDRALVVPS